MWPNPRLMMLAGSMAFLSGIFIASAMFGDVAQDPPRPVLHDMPAAIPAAEQKRASPSVEEKAPETKIFPTRKVPKKITNRPGQAPTPGYHDDDDDD